MPKKVQVCTERNLQKVQVCTGMGWTKSKHEHHTAEGAIAWLEDSYNALSITALWESLHKG